MLLQQKDKEEFGMTSQGIKCYIFSICLDMDMTLIIPVTLISQTYNLHLISSGLTFS